jgi:hypothetical protein
MKYLWWCPMTKVRIILWVSCFLFILPVSFSFAQPTGPRSSMGMGMRSWRGENRCWKASDLNLLPDQAKGLDLINQTYLRETRPLRTELFSKRLELREFLADPNVKAESIQLKNSEITELQSKLDGRTIDYLIKVRSLLTSEQLKSWCPEQEFPFLGGMMPRSEFMAPMHPRRIPPQERPREE